MNVEGNLKEFLSRIKAFKKMQNIFKKKCFTLLAVSLISTFSLSMIVSAEETYTVTPLYEERYSNAQTSFLQDADPGAPVIIQKCIGGIPLRVTGMTSNGFWQVKMNDRLYYVPFDGLCETRAQGIASTPVALKQIQNLEEYPMNVWNDMGSFMFMICLKDYANWSDHYLPAVNLLQSRYPGMEISYGAGCHIKNTPYYCWFAHVRGLDYTPISRLMNQYKCSHKEASCGGLIELGGERNGKTNKAVLQTYDTSRNLNIARPYDCLVTDVWGKMDGLDILITNNEWGESFDSRVTEKNNELLAQNHCVAISRKDLNDASCRTVYFVKSADSSTNWENVNEALDEQYKSWSEPIVLDYVLVP